MQEQLPPGEQGLSPLAFRRARGEGGRTVDQFNLGIKVSGALSAIAGWYAGLAMLLPLVLTILIGIVGHFVCRATRKPLVPAFSIQLGQIACFAIGFIALGSNRQGFIFLDIIWCGTGLVWLMAKPGRSPLYCLAIYQVISLVVNLDIFVQAPIGSVMSKGIACSIIWRVIALITMFELYQGMRRGTIVFSKAGTA